MTTQIANLPQKVTATPALLGLDVKRALRQSGVNAWFLTEVATPARAAALAAAVKAKPGFTLHHVTAKGAEHGQGENAIITRDSHYPVIHEVTVTQTTPGGGVGRFHDATYSVNVVAETVNGHIDVLTAMHTPAHVEGLFAHLPLPERTKARFILNHKRGRIQTYVSALHLARQGTMDLAAKWHADDVVFAPDGNLDAGKQWVQDLLARAWPGLHLYATSQGDLGKRTVGWVLTTMRMTSSHVIAQPGSDHDMGVYTLVRVNTVPHQHQKHGAGPAPDPFALVTYNGALMDNRCKVALMTLEATTLKDLAPLTVFQGCYAGVSGHVVSASAGTHDKGGVLDLSPFEYGRKVAAWRDLLGPLWHRVAIPGLWEEHCHGCMEGGNLSSGAAQQVVDYHNGLDGLADHARDTNQHHPAPTFDYHIAWAALAA